MTLHDAEARPNLHFLSFPVQSEPEPKRLVVPRILPMKAAVWLGAESNRRHVDFQSTALPTELPSRHGADRVAQWGVHYAIILRHGKALWHTTA
jgi:hypothetical protein